MLAAAASFSTGECWSGPQAQETYNRAGAKNTCITNNFEKCDVSDSKICVGEKETNFVYEVQRAGNVKQDISVRARSI